MENSRRARRMIRLIVTVFAAAGVVFAAGSVNLPEAKITVRVVDQDAHALSGVAVAITFELPKYRPGVWGSSEMLTQRGKSNGNGVFSATARAGNYVGFGAEAP